MICIRKPTVCLLSKLVILLWNIESFWCETPNSKLLGIYSERHKFFPVCLCLSLDVKNRVLERAQKLCFWHVRKLCFPTLRNFLKKISDILWSWISHLLQPYLSRLELELKRSNDIFNMRLSINIQDIPISRFTSLHHFIVAKTIRFLNSILLLTFYARRRKV